MYVSGLIAHYKTYDKIHILQELLSLMLSKFYISHLIVS